MGQQEDDIDRLLREVNAMTAGPSKAVTPAPGAQPAPTVSSGGGRATWTGVSAVGGGVLGGIVGSLLWFLPWISPGSTAVGAALGAAAVGYLSGPPRWFGRG